ncbi:UNVERIFIED_CONTAM: hypothetical protein ACS92_04325 [Bacillus cereus]
MLLEAIGYSRLFSENWEMLESASGLSIINDGEGLGAPVMFLTVTNPRGSRNCARDPIYQTLGHDVNLK